jgi:hypothetical protein
MTHDFPDIPSKQRGGGTGTIHGPDLECLTEEQKQAVIDVTMSLTMASQVDNHDVFSAALAQADRHGSHVMGHVLQGAVFCAAEVLKDHHVPPGTEAVIAFSGGQCEEADHQFVHEFAYEFCADAANGRWEDAMEGWKDFLADERCTYLEYVNVVYEVLRTAMWLAAVDEVHTEDTPMGLIVQPGGN